MALRLNVNEAERRAVAATAGREVNAQRYGVVAVDHGLDGGVVVRRGGDQVRVGVVRDYPVLVVVVTKTDDMIAVYGFYIFQPTTFVVAFRDANPSAFTTSIVRHALRFAPPITH